jgi:hypothetical protein
MADKKPAEAKAEAKVEHPDTPSGLGLAAAEGKTDAAAAEAYAAAKKQARWG